MKFSIFLFLAMLIISQVAVSPFIDLDSTGLEMPLEEPGDEDLDNEKELDQLFCHVPLPKVDLLITTQHCSVYRPSESEIIKEIIPPPPRA